MAAGGTDGAFAARKMAGQIGREGIFSMVLDTENRYLSLGLARELAELMEGRYESLQCLNSRQIQYKTTDFIRRDS